MNRSDLEIATAQSQYICYIDQQFAATHLYSWAGRGTVRVKFFAQAKNTTKGQWSGFNTVIPSLETLDTQTLETLDTQSNSTFPRDLRHPV